MIVSYGARRNQKLAEPLMSWQALIYRFDNDMHSPLP